MHCRRDNVKVSDVWKKYIHESKDHSELSKRTPLKNLYNVFDRTILDFLGIN